MMNAVKMNVGRSVVCAGCGKRQWRPEKFEVAAFASIPDARAGMYVEGEIDKYLSKQLGRFPQ